MFLISFMMIAFNYELDTLCVNFSSMVAELEQSKEPLLTMIIPEVKVGFRIMLKDKSEVVIIVDYSRFKILHRCEWRVSTFFNFFSFNLRDFIFQSAKKCEMTSFYMTSLHLDPNEAAKCVDAYCAFAHSYEIHNGDNFGLTYEDSLIYESSRHQIFERTHNWCSAVGKVAF